MAAKIAQSGQRIKPPHHQCKQWISTLNHGQHQRLRFLEARLLWEGEVNRRDVCSAFGITPNHFTREMRAYKEHFPENIWYDETSRSYRPTENFQPGLTSDSPREYLALLRAHAQHPADALRLELGGDVRCDGLRPPEASIHKNILRGILGAIHRDNGCAVKYQSFFQDKAEHRIIWPHALVWTGEHWHVRVFDMNRGMHMNLALTQIHSLEVTNVPPPPEAAIDSDWEEIETVEIIPNPRLSKGQQSVIAKEYGMTRCKAGWASQILLRRCLIPYFLFRYRLDEDRSNEIRAGLLLQQIVLRDPNIRSRYTLNSEWLY